MKLNDKRIFVFGTGISGISAVNLLQKVAADIIVYDGNDKLNKDEIKAKLPEDFNGTILLGSIPEGLIDTIDLVILSPGVPTDLELVNQMRDKKIPIWGEVELAYYFSKGKIVGITGTNGKTTTTTLVGEIMKTYFNSVFVVGNIGVPYTEMVLNTTEESVTVAEMSSFQLESIESFKPNVSAILNITPDHLNRHHTMENYIEAKKNITRNQDSSDVCVINYEDEVLRKIGQELKTKVFYFSSLHALDYGIYLEGENIIYNDSQNKTLVCNIQELNIFGRHSYENVMAAVACGISLGVPMDKIKYAITNFVAVEHRIEFVTTKHGVKYYNDSKGTNPDASMKAIESMQTPTLLIAGGYDKGSEYDEWLEAFGGKIRYLVLLGQTRDKIAETAKRHGFENIIMVESLEEAVNVCAKKANQGDSVLLSPACASWGMFKNYEERGHLFKEYVKNLD
ncbi:UDP-N-acetylmuramoyl-L-alanine--D-glutamate ligase [Anaerocolumna sedimenticola]|uniref:UDP-N-acetylmuramoylalanine--D-glutamate ligase n=1 Tax=Anaerocolumna sedimenticola TaxID=2696063 RepID=A0A6P1TNL3_9FIRM|nr:UDP-N-acetylmuramoyl-L-alanine--D-glutamate ligase [Anaerocolumna sedimenticola]QHQ62053.1 UDP-N-acetylmuramoyl-L-alanine--D-glutamate ligase [Anaerocolumna sedimenticola]